MTASRVRALQAKLRAAAAGLITATVVGVGVARADDGRYSACVNAGIDTNNCHLIINQADETSACNMDVGHGHNLVMGFSSSRATTNRWHGLVPPLPAGDDPDPN